MNSSDSHNDQDLGDGSGDLETDTETKPDVVSVDAPTYEHIQQSEEPGVFADTVELVEEQEADTQRMNGAVK